MIRFPCGLPFLPVGVTVFIERSRLGKVIYDFREDGLSFSGRRLLRTVRGDFALRDLALQEERFSYRKNGMMAVNLVVGVLLLGIAVGLILQPWLPEGGVHYFVMLAGTSGAAFFGVGIRFIPKIRVIRFWTVQGEVAFDLILENSYAAGLEEFVEKLKVAIARAEARRWIRGAGSAS